jgi:hypothetical protein
MAGNTDKGGKMETNRIVINGQEYIKASEIPSGKRAIVVIDRGWIFAGDVTEDNGHITLNRAVWVYRWTNVGFNGVIDNPKDPHVELRKMGASVEIPFGSVIFRIPVENEWGL